MSKNGPLIPKHLEQIIKEICKNLGIVLKNVEAKFTLKPGDNWLGEILDVDLFGEDDTKEPVVLHLVAKLAPTEEFYRHFFAIRQCFEREVFIYNRVLTEFIKLQNENRVKNPFTSYINCYQTSLDESRETLVLENMKKLRFKSLTHRKPLDYNHASMVLDVLGKFHALSFALKHHKPDVFNELVANTKESFLNSELRKPFFQIVKKLGTQICDYLDNDTAAYSAFTKFLENPYFVTDELVQPEAAGKYAVVGHGDLQTRNMLFKYENQDAPVDLCLLDWQLSRIGSPVLDISYFIWICTDKKLRDQHYEKLLEIYYESFASCLQDFKCNPDEIYPLRVFKQHLKKFSVVGMCMAIWIGCLNAIDVDDVPSINAAVTVESFVNMNSTVQNKSYFTLTCGMIEDFVRYGYNL